MTRYTVVHNLNTKEFFYARFHSSYNLSSDWVPCSFSLPMPIVAREGFEDGMIYDITGYEKVFHEGETKIAHPHPELDKLANIMEFYKALDALKAA